MDFFDLDTSSDEEYLHMIEHPELEDDEETEIEDSNGADFVDESAEEPQDDGAVERILIQSDPGFLQQIQRLLQHRIGIRANSSRYVDPGSREPLHRLQALPSIPYKA